MKDQTRGSTRSRRQHEREFKDELVAQSLVAGASVAAIAMRGGINANLLFKWRRAHVRAHKAPAVEARLLPVCVIPELAATTQVQPVLAATPVKRASRPGVIELEIAGAQLRLRGDVDETMLGCVLRALRQSA